MSEDSNKEEAFSPELTQAELKALTDDLQAVLEKHGAEMGVTSTINLLRSAPIQPDNVKNDGSKKEDIEEQEEAVSSSESSS